MLSKEVLAEILEAALKKGGEFAEIYLEDRKTNNIFCEDNAIERINSGREKGAGIRVIKEGKTAYVFTNDLTKESLIKAAHIAGRALSDHSQAKDANIKFRVKEAKFDIHYKTMPEDVEMVEKIEDILAGNKAARNVSKEIRQVTIAMGDVKKNLQIANSDGDYIEDEQIRVRLISNVVASRDNLIQTGYESAGGVCGMEILEQMPLEELAERAANLAIKMLDARPAPAGKMPVLMAAAAGGTMVHEACGHGLEADLVQKGLSVYKEMGAKVAADEVTVIDDATLANKYGSYKFDDEGALGQKTILIEDGYLKNYMYDYLTAQKDATSSTGNGRRQSYQHKPIPRMSNTFIAPGRDKPDEIIKSTKRGLLVQKMGGGQVNTTNGDFVFEVQEAYMIEDGEIKYPVRGATLTGNGPLALTQIDRVGSDLGYAIGTCGKGGQGVAVADAQPTIRIKELTVGGTSMADDNLHIKRIRRK